MLLFTYCTRLVKLNAKTIEHPDRLLVLLVLLVLLLARNVPAVRHIQGVEEKEPSPPRVFLPLLDHVELFLLVSLACSIPSPSLPPLASRAGDASAAPGMSLLLLLSLALSHVLLSCYPPLLCYHVLVCAE